MGGANQYRYFSIKGLNICGRVPSFYRNLCRYQVSCVVVPWLLSYVSSMTRRRKRITWTKCIIYPPQIFGTQITFDMFCAVNSLKLKLKARGEFPNVRGEYRNLIYRVLLYPVIMSAYRVYQATFVGVHNVYSKQVFPLSKWRGALLYKIDYSYL